MTHPFGLDGVPGRSYTRADSTHTFLDAAARRATRKLARRDTLVRELSELARWEGEGGALRPRLGRSVASPVARSMRFAMAARPAYDSRVRTDIEAMAAGPRAKAPLGFAADRNAGPPPRPRARQNAPTRPMNTHRGGRSR